MEINISLLLGSYYIYYHNIKINVLTGEIKPLYC